MCFVILMGYFRVVVGIWFVMFRREVRFSIEAIIGIMKTSTWRFIRNFEVGMKIILS